MSGSEQFLGRQLTKQAESLALLVQKMGQMIITQEKALGVFAIASDNSKKEKIYPTPLTISGKAISIGQIETYVTGKIKIKTYGNGGSINESVSFLVNGVSLGYVNHAAAAPTTQEIILTVREGDIIDVKVDQGAASGSLVNFKINICYDEIPKPNVNI